MKKTLFVAAALSAFVLVSCKKDFTCKCTDGGLTYEYTLKESKKSAAYAVCEGKGIGSVEFGGVASTSTESCEIQ
ncbi:MAG: hypothetical protein ACHQF2_01095 [Flavobacteriales bacterium]